MFLSTYERRARNARLRNIALVGLGYGALYLIASWCFGPRIGFVATSPLLGIIASVLIVNYGGLLYDGLRWLVWREEEGSYHAFDDIGVHVEWQDGQCRVAASDVFKVLGDAPDGDTCHRLRAHYGRRGFFQDDQGVWWFGEAALPEWLEQRARGFDQRALKFRLWLLREVFPPLGKRAEIQGLVALSPSVGKPDPEPAPGGPDGPA